MCNSVLRVRYWMLCVSSGVRGTVVKNTKERACEIVWGAFDDNFFSWTLQKSRSLHLKILVGCWVSLSFDMMSCVKERRKQRQGRNS